MSRVYNFSAGPSVLPESVLQKAAAEMSDYRGTGQSVMEMSHRSKAYKPIVENTEALLRELMGVPDNYKVLFLQGGASLQFAMVPLNLRKKGRAAYVDTGVWASKAEKEAKKWLETVTVASSKAEGYSEIPEVREITGDYDYVHITLNNTIMGTKWPYLPETGELPLVADISSCVLSEPLDVSKFGILYAGAQKNLGPAGVTLVIIRDDLITDSPVEGTPSMLRYSIHAENGSMYNTPPCYSIYMVGLVLEWMKETGGLAEITRRNQEKAALLYGYLDASDCYRATAKKGSRSLMNVPFLTKETDPEKADALNKKFVAEAAEAGLVNLAGHRLVGGMRASIYNAMPLSGVQALIAFMDRFAAANLH